MQFLQQQHPRGGVHDEPVVPAAAEAGGSAKWRLRPEVHWRCWDGAAIAFSEGTGNTHYFTDLAAWVLEHLAHRPMTARDLETAAAEEIQLPPENDIAPSLQASLEVLQTLNLLATLPPD